MQSTEEEARQLLDLLSREHPAEVLQELPDLIREHFPRGPGCPPGKGGEDDSDRIDRLVEVLKEGLDEDEAVRQVARDDPGFDEKNTRRRLRRKLPEALSRLKNQDPEREEIFKRAFAEDIEPWDL
ncbi:MAG: hypothetical protein AAF481_07810 [Acidobacteriota bacterium]